MDQVAANGVGARAVIATLAPNDRAIAVPAAGKRFGGLIAVPQLSVEHAGGAHDWKLDPGTQGLFLMAGVEQLAELRGHLEALHPSGGDVVLCPDERRSRGPAALALGLLTELNQ